MNKSKAFGAGVFAGLAVTVLLGLARWLNITPLDMSLFWGSLLTRSTGGGSWFLGFIIHLAVSGVIGLIYAWAFHKITHRATSGIGAGLGVVHAVIAGLLLAVVPAIHPLVPDTLSAPGYFSGNYGAASVIGFFLAHIIFGSIVGGMYQPVFGIAGRARRERPGEGRKAA